MSRVRAVRQRPEMLENLVLDVAECRVGAVGAGPPDGSVQRSGRTAPTMGHEVVGVAVVIAPHIGSVELGVWRARDHLLA